MQADVRQRTEAPAVLPDDSAMQLLTLQCLATGDPHWGGTPHLGRPRAGWAHFLSGQLLPPPEALPAGLSPALNGTSRIVCAAVLRLLLVDCSASAQAMPAPSLRRSGSGAAADAGVLADQLGSAAVPDGAPVLGSFAWAVDRIVCNITGRAAPDDGRRAAADAGRPVGDGRGDRGRGAQGFAFVARTDSRAAQALVQRLLADAERSFLPVLGDTTQSLRPASRTPMPDGPGRTRVVLSLAGLFETIDNLQPSQNSASDFRHMIRAERGG
jgi:hypothetical protein